MLQTTMHPFGLLLQPARREQRIALEGFSNALHLLYCTSLSLQTKCIYQANLTVANALDLTLANARIIFQNSIRKIKLLILQIAQNSPKTLPKSLPKPSQTLQNDAQMEPNMVPQGPNMETKS